MDGGASDAEEEEPCELPTLEEVARATGTLCSEPIGESVTVTSRGEREREREREGSARLLRGCYKDLFPTHTHCKSFVSTILLG